MIAFQAVIVCVANQINLYASVYVTSHAAALYTLHEVLLPVPLEMYKAFQAVIFSPAVKTDLVAAIVTSDVNSNAVSQAFARRSLREFPV